jgi:tetratricopeptide (TPR) repeat protein
VARDPLVSDRSLTSSDVVPAIAAVKRGATEQSLAALKEATRHADSSELHRVLGVAYAVASKHDASLTELRAAVRLSPDNERARLAVADVLMTVKDDAAARVALAETTKALPASGQAHWKLGRVHESFGDAANAVREFEAAARLAPFAGVGLLQASIGRLSYNQLDLDGASVAYRRRILAVPGDASSHRDLAEVFRAQDDLDAALSEALIAALLQPTDARSFAMIGQIHAASNRDEDAIVALRRAVVLDPDHLEAHYALSRALARVNKADEARAELQIFERLQAKAMAEQRQQFQQNLQKIEDTLKTADQKEPAR